MFECGHHGGGGGGGGGGPGKDKKGKDKYTGVKTCLRCGQLEHTRPVCKLPAARCIHCGVHITMVTMVKAIIALTKMVSTLATRPMIVRGITYVTKVSTR